VRVGVLDVGLILAQCSRDRTFRAIREMVLLAGSFAYNEQMQVSVAMK
jgi:hypothetical protein